MDINKCVSTFYSYIVGWFNVKPGTTLLPAGRGSTEVVVPVVA